MTPHQAAGQARGSVVDAAVPGKSTARTSKVSVQYRDAQQRSPATTLCAHRGTPVVVDQGPVAADPLRTAGAGDPPDHHPGAATASPSPATKSSGAIEHSACDRVIRRHRTQRLRRAQRVFAGFVARQTSDRCHPVGRGGAGTHDLRASVAIARRHSGVRRRARRGNPRQPGRRPHARVSAWSPAATTGGFSSKRSRRPRPAAGRSPLRSAPPRPGCTPPA